MPEYDVTTDATIPSSTSITITLFEDIGGSGGVDNSSSFSIGNGTNTYTVSNFDVSSGNDVWVKADFSSNDISNTAKLNSVDVGAATLPITIDGNEVSTVTIDGNVVNSITIDGTTIF
jgi:hypothetical protein